MAYRSQSIFNINKSFLDFAGEANNTVDDRDEATDLKIIISMVDESQQLTSLGFCKAPTTNVA